MNTREEIVEEAIRDLKAYVRESKKEIVELENAIRVLENDQESAKAKISQLTKLLIAKIRSSTAKENLLVAKVELLAALITPQKGISSFSSSIILSYPFFLIPQLIELCTSCTLKCMIFPHI